MKRYRGVPLAVALLPVILLAAGCGGGKSDPPAPGPATSGPPAVTAPPASTPPEPGGTGGGAGASPWTSQPIRVDRAVSIPPVPVLVGIRSAQHPESGYDRIVFDIQGQLPGYEVRYVPEVRGAASDLPVNVPGRRFLQITFRPAQAHTEAGQATVTERARTVNYPMLKAYAIVGDYEAVLTIALGLDDVVGFRIGELPGRIYVDVAA